MSTIAKKGSSRNTIPVVLLLLLLTTFLFFKSTLEGDDPIAILRQITEEKKSEKITTPNVPPPPPIIPAEPVDDCDALFDEFTEKYVRYIDEYALNFHSKYGDPKKFSDLPKKYQKYFNELDKLRNRLLLFCRSHMDELESTHLEGGQTPGLNNPQLGIWDIIRNL